MTPTCRIPHPLSRDGTSQQQRSTPSLSPSTVLIDERQLEDLLRYCRELSKRLRYYSLDGSPGGNWLELVESDPSMQLAVIAGTDVGEVRQGFDEIYSAFTDAVDPVAFPQLLPPIWKLARDVDRWYRITQEGLSLHSVIERQIRAVLGDAVRGAMAIARGAEEVGLDVEVLEPNDLAAIWTLEGIVGDKILFPPDVAPPKAALIKAGRRLLRLFERMHEALVSLVRRAPELLAESLDHWPAHPPHMALLLTFLQLLGHARDQLNTFTAQHLDFYYRRVLGLEPRAAEADRAHLIFGLAKGTSSHELPSDTRLKAGKDATGVALRYATDNDLIIRQTALDPEHGLKSIFVDISDDATVRGIYASPVANSADGLGSPLTTNDGQWPAFGDSPTSGLDMPAAEVGFAVASPMFRLAEGERTIVLTFGLARGPETNSPEVDGDLKGNIQIEASGEQGWIEVLMTSAKLTAKELTFELKVPAGEPAIVDYSSQNLDGGFVTPWPVIRLRLGKQEPNALSYPYKYLQDLEVAQLTIDVNVAGLRSLHLENDVGVLDPAKPFRAFGPVPKAGGSFLVGSHEAFQKPLTELLLAVTWADLPEENFTDHYDEYFPTPSCTTEEENIKDVPDDQGSDNPITGNDYFQASFNFLLNGEWSGKLSQPLFFCDETSTDLCPDRQQGPAKGRSISPPPSAKSCFCLDDLLDDLPKGLDLDPDLPLIDRYSQNLRRGFLRLTLEQDFLHSRYPLALARAAIASASEEIPNAPYTPLMAGLELTYKAVEVIDFASWDANSFADRTVSLLQIGPFGHREIFPIAEGDKGADAAGISVDRRLVPRFTVSPTSSDGNVEPENAEGTLLVGLRHAAPPEVLSLLVQVAEGSEEPGDEPSPIVWSYLANDEWVDFSNREVLADGSRGFIQSGIVRLALPATMTPSKHWLPGGLHWLKASIATGSKGTAKLIALHPQAGIASFSDQGNDLSHLATALPAGSIAKLETQQAAIRRVTQPYATFGGQPRESDGEFYVRVAERLRHRNQAVTLYDYERSVLENFPEVYKVRCLNHTDSGSEHAPGRVRVVVLPNLRNKNEADPLRPRLSRSRLDAICNYLLPLASDFVDLQVVNPEYEMVAARFDVRFLDGDDGFYAEQLSNEIVGFLSPWLYDDAADLSLGGSVHRSSIIDFIECRPYVDFVTNFEMDHFVPCQPPRINVKRDVKKAVATHASAALVSVASHEVRPGAVSCEVLPTGREKRNRTA